MCRFACSFATVVPWMEYHAINIVDCYYLKMLTILDERWKARLFPPRRFVPSESPRIRVPGIVFLDERA